MSNPIKITIAARCEKAARDHNEDNCLVCSNVASGIVDHAGDGTYLSPQIDLGSMGCLLVLADGMGGMNAGEVASQLAVEAVRNFFSKDKLDEVSLGDDAQVSRLVWDAIVYADACIKSEAVTDPEKSGMGTTIVLLWILGHKAYIGWCGDSRIYRFNKKSKILNQLSKDHSYVQMLVDQHQITEEEAFDHPDSNMIMRSLGDAFEEVNPEVLRPLNLTEDDVFMMCSDGLCGVLRNSEIRTIMTRASVEYPIKRLNGWNDLLWEHARQAGWHDNVTTLLCHIGNCQPAEDEAEVAKAEKGTRYNRKDPKLYAIVALIAVAVVIGGIVAFLKVIDKKSSKSDKPAVTEQVVDSTEAAMQKQQKQKELPGIQDKKEDEQKQPSPPARKIASAAQQAKAPSSKQQGQQAAQHSAPQSNQAASSAPVVPAATPATPPPAPPKPGATGENNTTRKRDF